jgi:succinate dehydrogenase flavin-adding protein (antitoxin of CptAB toxin-antitoxin module)
VTEQQAVKEIKEQLRKVHELLDKTDTIIIEWVNGKGSR